MFCRIITFSYEVKMQDSGTNIKSIGVEKVGTRIR
jgi:hypothetical protein